VAVDNYSDGKGIDGYQEQNFGVSGTFLTGIRNISTGYQEQINSASCWFFRMIQLCPTL